MVMIEDSKKTTLSYKDDKPSVFSQVFAVTMTCMIVATCINTCSIKKDVNSMIRTTQQIVCTGKP